MRELENEYLRQKIWDYHRQQLIEKLAMLNDPESIPMLLGALEDQDTYISFLAADLLGNFSGNIEIGRNVLEILEQAVSNVRKSSRYDGVDTHDWQLLFASCTVLAKVGVSDFTLLAKLRKIFFGLVTDRLKYHESPPTRLCSALWAVGLVLSLTDNAVNEPLLHSVGILPSEVQSRKSPRSKQLPRSIPTHLAMGQWGFMNE